jgi:glycosyltransferase involved in cell wall biosynthesis
VNVLYVTTASPWSTTYGGAIRSNGLLRGLSARHSVTIGFFTPDPTSAPGAWPAGIEHIHSIPMRDTRAWLGWPHGRAARQHCLELVRRCQPDVVWCFEKDAARLAATPPGTPLVIDLDGASWPRLSRAAAQQRGLARGRTLLRAAASWSEERRLCQRADITVLAYAGEARLLGARTARRVCTIPNGADFSLPPRPGPRATKRILHLGGLWYPPNWDGLRWFLREVWPRVLAAEPDAWLDVVGACDAEADECGAAPHVNRCGFLGDLAAVRNASALLVVPLRIASGTRTKILEAWAHGLPVVSTTIGVEGLGARDAETALIADTGEGLAAACVRLLRSPALGVDLAARAFAHGRREFDWEAIYPALDDVLARAARRHSERAMLGSGDFDAGRSASSPT